MTNFQGHEAVKLWAMLEYWSDPLNTAIPIPDRVQWDMVEELCDCGATPEMMHGRGCAALGLYGALAEELDCDPFRDFSRRAPSGDWWMEGYYPLYWVCSSRETDEFHTGYDINGPDHWCEREKRVVIQGG
jgi:hypothetical protein